MSVIRYDLADAKSPISRSTPEGAGDVFIRIEVETSFAEAARAAALNSMLVRDAILAGLRRAVQQITEELHR